MKSFFILKIDKSPCFYFAPPLLTCQGFFFTVPSIFFCSRFINSFATTLAFIPKMEPPPIKSVCMIFSGSVATSSELSCGTRYEVNDSIFNQYQLVMYQCHSTSKPHLNSHKSISLNLYTILPNHKFIPFIF